MGTFLCPGELEHQGTRIQFRYQDNTRKQGNNEDTSLKAIVCINSVDLTGVIWQRTVLKREVACKDYEINVLKSEFEKAKQEKEGIEFKIEKFDNASKSLDKLLWSQITEKSKKDLGYDTVPLPHPLIYNGPTKLDLSYSGLDEFKDPKFKSYVLLRIGPEQLILLGHIQHQLMRLGQKGKMLLRPQHVGFGDLPDLMVHHLFLKDTTTLMHEEDPSNMTVNIAYLLDFKEFNRCYVTFGGGAHGGRISGKGTLKTDSLDFKDVYFVNELNFNLFSVSKMCDKKNYVLFTDTECLALSPNFKLPDENQILLKVPRKDNMTPQQNGVAERRNRTLIEAARTIGFKPALSFMRPFGCHVTILNTLDSLGKFDGKSDKGFFVGYTLSSKAFRKDSSYFDSPTKNVDNGEPKTADDAQKQVEDGLNDENAEQERFADDSSSKDVNAVGQQVNTASLDVNTGSLELNVVGPSVSTASADVYHDEDEPEVDLGNIINSYIVPTTPNTRIHKDHPIDNVIG
ncbi:putative ribonuclease H-like domain-containing protein [Tanacetum coccineum]|uniref:Ribonuclease H-like domain-containing protein n=1 Tax=Tanacetum coccineum TaxID=301880 RepID=A0ABQ4ZMC6_9ASTR